MKVDLFDFELPPERIALRPARRAMPHACCGARRGPFEDRGVRDLPRCCGRRRARVQTAYAHPAQLEGRRGEARSARRCTSGSTCDAGRLSCAMPSDCGSAISANSAAWRRPRKTGSRMVSFVLAFAGEEPVEILLERAGRMPLPPYIAGKRATDAQDREDIRRCSQPRTARLPHRLPRFTRLNLSGRSTLPGSGARR